MALNDRGRYNIIVRFRYELQRANRRDFFVSRLVSTSHYYTYRSIVCDIVIVITIIVIIMMRGGGYVCRRKNAVVGSVD